MQAAANRSAAPSGVRSAVQNEDFAIRARADDGALLDALPIAAGVFGLKQGKLWMDIGRGEVVKLPPEVRDAWWEGTTREWPFMAADMNIGRDTLMAHYLSNHVAVAYGDIFGEMVALSQELGFKVRILEAKA